MTTRHSGTRMTPFIFTVTSLVVVPVVLNVLEHLIMDDGALHSDWLDQRSVLERVGILAGVAVAPGLLWILAAYRVARAREAKRRAPIEVEVDQLARYRAVVTTVGRPGKPRIQPAVFSLSSGRERPTFERIAVVRTDVGKPYLEEIDDASPGKVVDLVVTSDAMQVKRVRQAVLDELSVMIDAYGRDHVVVDYTGGMASMTAGAVLAAAEARVDMLYVHLPRGSNGEPMFDKRQIILTEVEG